MDKVKITREPVNQLLSEVEINFMEEVSEKLEGLADVNVRKLIYSHRILFAANAELSFKNQKYKQAVEEVRKYLLVDGDAISILDKALEELK